MEKIEAHLIDKATDTAEIIDGRVTAMFQFLEGKNGGYHRRDCPHD
ncbi:MAG: hypothetical protein ACTTJ7_00690 [Treponema sp.]